MNLTGSLIHLPPRYGDWVVIAKPEREVSNWRPLYDKVREKWETTPVSEFSPRPYKLLAGGTFREVTVLNGSEERLERSIAQNVARLSRPAVVSPIQADNADLPPAGELLLKYDNDSHTKLAKRIKQLARQLVSHPIKRCLNRLD